MRSKVVTIDRHILDQEQLHPGATGRFSALLYDIALAAKIISREVNMAGLIDVLGRTGETNVQGEPVQKLDVFAQEAMVKAMDHAGHLCCMVSEEEEDIIPIPERFDIGPYVLLFDPLDGSSNINVNVSIGTIFSVHHRRSPRGRPGTLKDCLQKGWDQLAAGYVIYGSSTMLVYTTGVSLGAHGFTLDPSIGEFLLSHPDIRIPEPPAKVYSINEAYYARWSRGPAAAHRPFPGRERGRRGHRRGRLEVALHRFPGLGFPPNLAPGGGSSCILLTPTLRRAS